MSGPRIPRRPELQLVEVHEHDRLFGGCFDQQPGANAGTIDPQMLHHLASQAEPLVPMPIEWHEAYIEGFHHGAWHGLLAGLVVGCAVVAAAIQAGWWVAQ